MTGHRPEQAPGSEGGRHQALFRPSSSHLEIFPLNQQRRLPGWEDPHAQPTALTAVLLRYELQGSHRRAWADVQSGTAEREKTDGQRGTLKWVSLQRGRPDRRGAAFQPPANREQPVSWPAVLSREQVGIRAVPRPAAASAPYQCSWAAGWDRGGGYAW